MILMTKKEMVLYVLNKLPSHEIIWDDFQVFVASDYFDDKALDALISLLSQALVNMKAKSQKDILWKSLDALKKIRELEERSDEWEFDLDSILDDFN